MLRGIAQVAVIMTLVTIIAAFSVVGTMLVIDSTRLLTMTTSSTDDTFYALADNCDEYVSATCE
jgi:hypothetical protein